MGVLDGQAVDEAVTNPAFINKNQDDQMPNQLDFTSANPLMGPIVTNIQLLVNAIFSFVGTTKSTTYNVLPTWLSNNFGTPADSVYERVTAIDEAFDPVTGAFAERDGIVACATGGTTVTAVFSQPFPDTNYSVVCGFVNQFDPNPIFLQYMITALAASGFTATLNAPPDSGNYALNYQATRFR